MIAKLFLASLPATTITAYQNCHNIPCKNQAQCVLDAYSAAGFRCICPPAYTGIYCDQVLNPCQSTPCQNAGICQMQPPYSFSCQCPQNFQGQFCEIQQNSRGCQIRNIELQKDENSDSLQVLRFGPQRKKFKKKIAYFSIFL